MLRLDAGVRIAELLRVGDEVLARYAVSDDVPPLVELLGRTGFLAIGPGEVRGWYGGERET